VKPDIIAVTQNDPQLKNKQRQAKKVGGAIKIVSPHINNLTSTRLIKKLAEFFF